MAADLGYFVDDVTVKARTCLRQMCWDTTGIYVRLPLLDFYAGFTPLSVSSTCSPSQTPLHRQTPMLT
jgi:hypothetical protein